MYLLAVLNFPSTAVLITLFQPLSYLIPNVGTTAIWVFLIIVVVTLQWLSIGAMAQAIYEETYLHEPQTRITT